MGSKLYFVFTVDGDWEAYYNPKLPEKKRKPQIKQMLSYFNQEISIAQKLLSGKFIHFVHTSPRARDFFLKRPFIGLWEKIEKNGGSIGIHSHEDDPRKAYYYNDVKRMGICIRQFSSGLRKAGLDPISYRGGYLAFCKELIPLLEKNKLFLDFSCLPGRFLKHGENLVSDWRGAPHNFYRLSKKDHRQRGNSQIFEIPVGFYLEKMSLFSILKKAQKLKSLSKKSGDVIIVSVLAHAFNFKGFLKKKKIEWALRILRRFGSFLNATEALKLAEE